MDKFQFTIEPLSSIDASVLEAMRRLTAQLNSSNQATLTTEYLEDMLANNAFTLFVARLVDEKRTIIGMQGVVIYTVPTNVRAILENGAVDSEYTGNGVLSSLIQKAIELAYSKKVNTGRTSIAAGNDAARHILTELGFVPEEGYIWFEYNVQRGNRF